MERWKNKILNAREEIEVLSGRTPDIVVVRPEVWGEICAEEGEVIDDIDGIAVAVAVSLLIPFKFYMAIEEAE